MIEIEVYEKQGVPGYSPHWRAQIKGQPHGPKGEGFWSDMAVGNLVRENPEIFGITVKHGRKR